jgi:NADPH:quinone reductase-like Zn-dependent oxidoreductase
LAAKQGIEARFFIVHPRRSKLEELAALLAEGSAEVSVGKTFPLSEGRAAYAGEGRDTPGKPVLLVRTADAD